MIITINKLWDAMPRDVQRKISLHDLRRIVDNLEAADKKEQEDPVKTTRPTLPSTMETPP